MSAVSPKPTTLITASVVDGCVHVTSQAVSEAYIGLLTVNAGNAASALITPSNNITVGSPSAAAGNTHIPITPLASQSAHATEFASTNSRLLSVGSKYISFQKANVAPAVPVMVIHVYFPSALRDGSNAMLVFSASVIVPPVVNADGVTSVGDVIVLFVRFSDHASVARVPVVGSVTLVDHVVVNVNAFVAVRVNTSPHPNVIEFVANVVLSETVNVLLAHNVNVHVPVVIVLPFTVVGVIAHNVIVIAGVDVAVATDQLTPLAVVTDTDVTVHDPTATRAGNHALTHNTCEPVHIASLVSTQPALR